MQLRATAYRVPKEEYDLPQCQDAFAPSRQGRLQGRSFRFGVSDGASQSMLSGEWARLLSRAWCRSRGLAIRPEAVCSLLERATSDWEAWLRDYLQGRQQAGRPIRWFEEAHLERGAFATLLGVRFGPSPGRSSSSDRRGRWNAVALGDSCMFQVRAEALEQAFPLGRSDQFGRAPQLVCSRPDTLEATSRRFRFGLGSWRAGDRFYLVTDAVAAWFLASVESGARPWQTLDEVDANGAPEWAAALRAKGEMHNDDVTVVRLHVR